MVPGLTDSEFDSAVKFSIEEFFCFVAFIDFDVDVDSFSISINLKLRTFQIRITFRSQSSQVFI